MKSGSFRAGFFKLYYAGLVLLSYFLLLYLFTLDGFAMENRRKGREFALQLLFQGDMNDWQVDDLAIEFLWDTVQISSNIKQFAIDIYRGVCNNRIDIDTMIESNSKNWRLDRMSRVDRNILRLAAYEIVYRNDIPSNVSMNEAIEIGKRFGTAETSSFLNGILDNLSKTNLSE